MGAKSTRNVSRSEAVGFILRALASVDDRSLALVLEDVNDGLRNNPGGLWLGLHNFRITEETE